MRSKDDKMRFSRTRTEVLLCGLASQHLRGNFKSDLSCSDSLAPEYAKEYQLYLKIRCCGSWGTGVQQFTPIKCLGLANLAWSFTPTRITYLLTQLCAAPNMCCCTEYISLCRISVVVRVQLLSDKFAPLHRYYYPPAPTLSLTFPNSLTFSPFSPSVNKSSDKVEYTRGNSDLRNIVRFCKSIANLCIILHSFGEL